MDVTSGVPQGIVLGPLLFLCFINDLPESKLSSDTKLFADDSLPFKVTENENDRELLQRDLSTLELWEETWQMRFNPTKRVVLRISNKKKPTRKTDYQLHGHILEVVDASKYLGVTLTEDLSWDKHIQNTVSKANRTVGFLLRNLSDCTPTVKASTFKIMVLPIFEYASPVWDPHLQANIKAFEQVQRRAARYVFNDFSTRTPGCVTKMLDDLEWEPLEVRRRHGRFSMLYRMQHNLVDKPANRYMSPSDSRTRVTIKFYQERISDTNYTNSFPRTAKEWNKLPTKSCVCSIFGRIQVIPPGVTCSITGIREVTVYSF